MKQYIDESIVITHRGLRVRVHRRISLNIARDAYEYKVDMWEDDAGNIYKINLDTMNNELVFRCTGG